MFYNSWRVKHDAWRQRVNVGDNRKFVWINNSVASAERPSLRNSVRFYFKNNNVWHGGFILGMCDASPVEGQLDSCNMNDFSCCCSYVNKNRGVVVFPLFIPSLGWPGTLGWLATLPKAIWQNLKQRPIFQFVHLLNIMTSWQSHAEAYCVTGTNSIIYHVLEPDLQSCCHAKF